MTGDFTTREVAKILGFPEARVRSCIRAGLLSPERGSRRRHRFSFQDLLILKTTKGLLDSRVPMQRIRGILQSLRRQLPEQRQLSSVTIYADGHRVVVWDGNARWQPDSGQFLLNFGVQSVAKEVAIPVVRAEPEGSALSATDWFDLGYELEKTSPQEALHAYEQALELDPEMADAHINLGRLYHQKHEREVAETHYRAAIRHAPGEALGYFNLGVLLEDAGREEEVLVLYRQALALDPSFADAHYNLALLYEARGRKSEAISHFRAARKIYDRTGK